MAEGGTAIHYASDLATKMVRESFGELPEVGAVYKFPPTVCCVLHPSNNRLHHAFEASNLELLMYIGAVSTYKKKM